MKQLNSSEINQVSGGMIWQRGEPSNNVFFQGQDGTVYESFGNIWVPTDAPAFDYSL
jgi:hypothetical protein